VARTPAHHRHVRVGAPKAKTKKFGLTSSDYRTLEAIAAQATEVARAEPSANTYRAAAASHRVAARAAEDAGMADHVDGHDLFARELDETAEAIAADRRAESLRSGPDLETEVQQILSESARRTRARR
jgi:enoyl-CoA hydratase/carnithine racemase